MNRTLAGGNHIFLDRGTGDISGYCRQRGTVIPVSILSQIQSCAGDYVIALVMDSVTAQHAQDESVGSKMDRARAMHGPLLDTADALKASVARAYEELNVPVVHIPVLPLPQRMDAILNAMKGQMLKDAAEAELPCAPIDPVGSTGALPRR